MLNHAGVQLATRLLGGAHAEFLVRLANRQDALEQSWLHGATQLHTEIVDSLMEQCQEGERLHVDDELVIEFLVRHYFSVAGVAAESAEAEMEVVAPDVHLARPKRPLPRSLPEIRKIYDTYRKTGRLPKAFRDRANEIKAQYLKKTQAVWRKYSEDFRNGDTATQTDVLRKVAQAANTVQARTKTIVRTETTNYYNSTRREIYDQADAVWGYLFLAIRDQATTKWCTDEVRNGKRGRHGLVYKKGDPLTDRETPGCHWNCRSEMVPLVIHNPRHKRLIEDESKRRRNHTCHPLPHGWR